MANENKNALKGALDRLATAIKNNIGVEAVYPFTIEEMCNIAGGTAPVPNKGKKGKEGFFYYMEKMADCIAQRCDVELPLTIEEMIEVLGEISSVNITLDCAFGGYSNNSTVRVKFGLAPTDNSDSDYYYQDGAFMVSRYGFDGAPGSITVQSKAYIWYTTITGQEDNLVGYKLNNGSVITPGYGYSNATKIELKEGDILTLISTMLD